VFKFLKELCERGGGGVKGGVFFFFLRRLRWSKKN